MRCQRAVIFLGAIAIFACGADVAYAQGFSTCAKVLWEFVGKPLTGVMVEKGGGLLFDHFSEKFKGRNEVIVTQNDIRTLSRNTTTAD